MAIVKSYIVYKELHKRRSAKPKLSHAQLKKVLHLQLLGLTDADVLAATLVTAPSPVTLQTRPTSVHAAVQVNDPNDLQEVGGKQKRRQRSCKVCSLLIGERGRGYQATFYCEAGSDGDKWTYLCSKARRSINGNPVTCFDIWHKDWQQGKSLPSGLSLRMIRGRAPSNKPGKKKRRRLDSDLRSAADEEKKGDE